MTIVLHLTGHGILFYLTNTINYKNLYLIELKICVEVCSKYIVSYQCSITNTLKKP